MTRRRLLNLVWSLVLAFTVAAHAADSVTVIVKLRPGTNPSLIANLLGGTVVDSIPAANTYLLKLAAVPVVTPQLKEMGVEWIEKNGGVGMDKAGKVKKLKGYGRRPDWYQDQPAFKEIDFDRGLFKHSSGRGVLIADINTRVDYGHPSLAGHLGAGYDFVSGKPTGVNVNDDQSTAGFLDDDQSTAGFLDDDQSTAGFLDDNGISLSDDQSTAGFLDGNAVAHGTFVMGIIAAIAPDATIMPLRAFDDNGNTDFFTVAKSIRYATHNGAQVINMSFGTLTNSMVLKDAIDEAKAWNVVLVASAGNNSTSAAQYPAAYPGVMAVASTVKKRRSFFSNYGSYVFVAAPGENIISATPGGGYGLGKGTSFSAPMVTGLAALIRSLKYNEVQTVIATTSTNLDKENRGFRGMLGYGQVHVHRALHAVDKAVDAEEKEAEEAAKETERAAK